MQTHQIIVYNIIETSCHAVSVISSSEMCDSFYRSSYHYNRIICFGSFTSKLICSAHVRRSRHEIPPHTHTHIERERVLSMCSCSHNVFLLFLSHKVPYSSLYLSPPSLSVAIYLCLVISETLRQNGKRFCVVCFVL